MPERRRYTATEKRLLREAQDFLRRKIHELEAMLPASVALRERMADTTAWKRVNGRDVAELDPLWDLWATLDICFERYLREGVEILAACVENPGAQNRDRR